MRDRHDQSRGLPEGAPPNRRSTHRRHGGTLRGASLWLLRQQPFCPLCKATASVVRVQIAALVHEPHRGDGEDAVTHRELIAPAFAVEMLRPGQFLLLE